MINLKVVSTKFYIFFSALTLLLYAMSFAHANQENERPFYMSMTYQPYDWSDQAFADTHAFIRNNADATFFYFDDGVPWPEALQEKPFHDNVEADISAKAKQAKNNKKTFIGVNFLGKDRASLAAYWAEQDSMFLPENWAQKSLKDEEVAKAYIEYCKRMIAAFDPDIFVYGMEIDSINTDVRSEEFLNLKAFLSKVYSQLKKEFPNLPLVLTFVLLPEQDMKQKRQMIKELLPFTDIYAVSVYPYLFDGIAGDANKIPKNLFSQMRDYIGDKPFAIAETGFNAKTWRVLSKLIWISGTEKSQAQYMRTLLQEAEKLDAVFVNWWVPRDLDALWEKMKASGADPMLSQWNSNGLLTADGQERLSFEVWKNWHEKRKQ